MTTEIVKIIQDKYGLNIYTDMKYDYTNFVYKNKNKIVKRIGRINVVDFIKKSNIRDKEKKIEEFELMQKAFKGSLNFTFKEYTNGKWNIVATYYYVPVYEEIYLELATILDPETTKDIESEIKKRKVKKMFVETNKKSPSLYQKLGIENETLKNIEKRIASIKRLMIKRTAEMMKEINEVQQNA